jgi:HPr kinase/phosphorylase
VLLVGPPGAGKSRLLLRLLDRGFDLVADDRVMVDDLIARPPAALAGLIEVRGLGLLRLPHRAAVRLALAVACVPPAQVPRLPTPRQDELGLPLILLDAADPAAPAVVDRALDVIAGRAAMLAGALAA